MKTNKNNNNLQKLTDKGYSKTKAAQALKDAGNNFDLALKILERQNPKPKQPKTPVLSGFTVTGSDEPPKESGPKLSLFEMEENKKKTKKHPCIVQYKSCRYGQFCFFKELPGDVCIEYARGMCIHGEFCKRRHHLDGQDIREMYREYYEENIIQDGEGKRYEVSDKVGDKVQTAVRHAAQEDERNNGSEYTFEPSAGPEDAFFHANYGPEPTHTDPYDNTTHYTAVSSSIPRPFLEKLQQGLSNGDAGRVGGTRPVVAVAPNTSERKVSRKKHPCVHQLGSCRYGDVCQHVNRDADVCVFFLNGHCRNTTETCKYRHETDAEYRAKLLEETNQRREAVQLWKNDNDGGAASLAEDVANVLEPQHEWQNTDEENCDDNGNQAPGGHADEEIARVLATNPAGEEELETFMNLLVVYPDHDPAVIFGALRSSHGDPVKVSDFLARLDASEAPGFIDAELARAIQEEEDARFVESTQDEERLRVQQENRTNTLLTLCDLFPSVDIEVVEGVLEQNKGDFPDAYEVLLCSQKNIERKKCARVTAYKDLKGDEKLKLDKLKGMFPDIDGQIVQNTFFVAERNMTTSIALLNELTSEMMSLDTREKIGREAMRWRNPTKASDASLTNGVPAKVDSHGFATNEEMIARYKDIENEVREFGDWRTTRKRAYLINSTRIQLLSQATAAFHRGDKKTATQLSQEAKRLGAEYAHLNQLSMMSLEAERLSSGSTSSLDLHGFHADEAYEVLSRRVELCMKKRINNLTIIMGEGRHSKRGRPSIYPKIMEVLKSDPYLISNVEIKSVRPAYVEVKIKLPKSSDVV